MMHRNLDRRVEVLLRVADEPLAAQLGDVLDSCLDPATRCWTLRARRRVGAVAVAGLRGVAGARPPGRDDAAATRGPPPPRRNDDPDDQPSAQRAASTCWAAGAVRVAPTDGRRRRGAPAALRRLVVPQGQAGRRRDDAVRGRARGRRGDRARRARSARCSATCATRCRRAASWCGTGRRAWRRTTGSPPDAEVDELRWVARRAGRRAALLRPRPGRAAALRRPHGRPTSTILLVRHGKAGSRSQWDGDDDERPLSSSGREQAEHLAALLPLFGPGAGRERAAAALPRHDRAAGRAARPAGRRRAAAGRGRLLGAARARAWPACASSPRGRGVTAVCEPGRRDPGRRARAGAGLALPVPVDPAAVPSRKASTWVLGVRGIGAALGRLLLAPDGLSAPDFVAFSRRRGRFALLLRAFLRPVLARLGVALASFADFLAAAVFGAAVLAARGASAAPGLGRLRRLGRLGSPWRASAWLAFAAAWRAPPPRPRPAAGCGPRAGRARSRRPPTAVLNPMPGRNAGTVAAGTATVWPVRGLRPTRAARALASKTPKPVSDTDSPALTVSTMVDSSPSTADAAVRRSPRRAASASMSWDLFMVWRP